MLKKREKQSIWKKLTIIISLLFVVAIIAVVGLFAVHRLGWIDLQNWLFPENEQASIDKFSLTYDDAYEKIIKYEYMQVSIYMGTDDYTYRIFINKNETSNDIVTFKDTQNKMIDIFYGVIENLESFYIK